mmetsp:Transcript_64132/g.121492  ORF Transcript_64132/g.121492 Transcript_64132/m.121492 type:complete len:211 (+) Transcript_64132:981-1613(+)
MSFSDGDVQDLSKLSEASRKLISSHYRQKTIDSQSLRLNCLHSLLCFRLALPSHIVHKLRELCTEAFPILCRELQPKLTDSCICRRRCRLQLGHESQQLIIVRHWCLHTWLWIGASRHTAGCKWITSQGGHRSRCCPARCSKSCSGSCRRSRWSSLAGSSQYAELKDVCTWRRRQYRHCSRRHRLHLREAGRLRSQLAQQRWSCSRQGWR